MFVSIANICLSKELTSVSILTVLICYCRQCLLINNQGNMIKCNTISTNCQTIVYLYHLLELKAINTFFCVMLPLGTPLLRHYSMPETSLCCENLQRNCSIDVQITISYQWPVGLKACYFKTNKRNIYCPEVVKIRHGYFLLSTWHWWCAICPTFWLRLCSLLREVPRWFCKNALLLV